MSFSHSLEKAWNRPVSWALLLLPLSWVFRFVACLRRNFYQRLSPKKPLSVPVVVVGNISVGGTGKTPLLISLVNWLSEQGYRPGVISRGYGGNASHYPMFVTPESAAKEVGDEPLLLAGACPVVIDPDRYRAAQSLLAQTDCNLILSDDGLQHYRLPRDVEIVVVDGERGFGNGQCLPAGPLREPVGRLKSVDFILVNGSNKGCVINRAYSLSIKPKQLRHLASGEVCDVTAYENIEGQADGFKLPQWQFGRAVHAVAGIGNPHRFVTTLEQLGFDVQLHAWPDHHNFEGDELLFEDALPVIITAKDAVKCHGLANDNVWVLDISAVPEAEFLEKLNDRVSHMNKTI